MDEATRVVFRVYSNGDVIALFPGERYSTLYLNLVTSYMHIGQHAGADYDGVIRHTKPATPEQYADLYEELTTQVGYTLRVVTRR